MKTLVSNRTKLATAIGVAMISSSAVAEIELGNGFKVTGFIDMSAVYTETDVANSTSTSTFKIEQVETDFMYSGSDGISAQVDIEYGESGDGTATNADETFVEQAFITKKFNDQWSAKAGRFLSYSGWETQEPTGLYQNSSAGYGSIFYGGYQQGFSASYSAGMFSVMGSLINDAFNPTDRNNEATDVELGVAVTPMESVVAKLFYIDAADDALINFWTSYAKDAWTLALELNMRDNDENSTAGYKEASGYLLMANYKMGKYGITGRYHAWETENTAGAITEDKSGITIAPSMSVGDNLLLVAEYRMDTDDVAKVDTDTIAIEALFTF